MATAWAQESSIQGVVTDESGAVVPGVEVTVTHLATGVTRNTLTNDAGFYSFPRLQEGRYRVEGSLPGFKRKRTEVRATAQRIQQQPYSVGTVVEERQIHELPLNGRNFLTLAKLTPGILRGAQGNRGEQTGTEKKASDRGGCPWIRPPSWWMAPTTRPAPCKDP